jgi:preprotein translocase subunit SecY
VLSAFTNSLKIPELRSRIFYTLALLFVARVGAHIPLPGLNPAPLAAFFKEQASSTGGALVGLYNMFTGGALVKGAVFALGIMPYISASIIFQLMTAVVPALSRLQQEGDVGRQKLTQYTRYATLLICLVQGTLLILALENPSRLFGAGFDVNHYGSIVIATKTWFLITSVIFMTAGTLLLMWLGEQITQRGIGNGISLLITIGILADIPGAATATYQLFNPAIGVGGLSPLVGVMMIALFVLVTMGIIMVVQGQRKIPVQYAKRVVGNKVMGGQSSFLPLKVNYSGVMPVIFASAILLFPQQIFSQVGAAFNLKFLVDFSQNLLRGHWVYYVTMGTLILFFSYFWVSVMFKPIQIADDLKKYGGYIPGVRPGEPTAKFLDFIMTRMTLSGAIFLTIIAVLPDLLLSLNHKIPQRVAVFFGGTGMLITVGVILETMKQIETFLLQRHYDGFLKKGRVRARSSNAPGATGDALSSEALMKVAIPLLGLLLLGVGIWAYRILVK